MTPRLLDRKGAASYCGVSPNTFSAHVEPHVGAVAIGSRRLWDVRALDGFIDRMAAHVVDYGGWVVEAPK